ncbi:MAG: ArsS family sensor histidine kinase [Campylobacterota bacterium]|nr:ArsS family sensor histidine kinase [Campylobacterota bacterium]
MFRHSVFFKLNILFAIALIATLIAGFSIVAHISKKDRADLTYKIRILIKEMRHTKEKPIELFKEFHLQEIYGKERQHILKNANYHKMHRLYTRDKKYRKRSRILYYQGDTYVHIVTREVNLLLKVQQNVWERFSVPLLIFLSIIILLIVMYVMIRKSLVPLKKLERDIVAYGDGEFPDYILSKKQDEISLVSNAFYNAIEKSKELLDSRQLFVRNIFHELNTPITKGKILTEIVEDTKTQEMLDSIFSRLAMLLQELAHIEKITAGDYTIEQQPIPIVELIDQAKDLLYIESDIPSNIHDEVIKADFNLMSIVFKNLIENAQKYAQHLEIIYHAGELSFVSDGEQLEYPLSHYTQAFTKGSKEEKGFGLGLYIVSEILTKHQMRLGYSYREQKNIFIIDTNPTIRYR